MNGKRKILIIDNQKTQFDKISSFLTDYEVLPRPDEYKRVLDWVRIYLNPRYGKDSSSIGSRRGAAFNLLMNYIRESEVGLLIIDYILVGNHIGNTGISLANHLRLQGITQPILFLSKVDRYDERVQKEVISVENYEWLPKGYSGQQNLSDKYFNEKVASKIQDMLNDISSVPNGQLNILSLATEWYSSKGGLSTFNRILCRTLGKQGYNVHCYVPEATEEEKVDALAGGVKLVVATKQAKASGSPLNLCPNFVDNVQPHILIGHDRFTGHFLYSQSKYFPKAKRLVFIHTDPNSIGQWQDDSRLQEKESKVKTQREIAEFCDLIIAVGPLLYRNFSTTLGYDSEKHIVQFNPGLYFPTADIKYDYRADTNPDCLIYGRMKDFKPKGVDIACNAVGNVINPFKRLVDKEVRLFIRGITEDEKNPLENEIKKLSLNYSPYLINYNSAEGEISKHIRQSALVLMPSRHEGFGLVGLEAISNGRPVLISENSGLAELLRGILPDSEYKHWVLPVDRDDERTKEIWSEAIIRILRDRTKAKEELRQLAIDISEQITWEGSVEYLMAKVREL